MHQPDGLGRELNCRRLCGKKHLLWAKPGPSANVETLLAAYSKFQSTNINKCNNLDSGQCAASQRACVRLSEGQDLRHLETIKTTLYHNMTKKHHTTIWFGKKMPSTEFPHRNCLRGRALVHFYVGVICMALVTWSPFTLWTKRGARKAHLYIGVLFVFSGI